MDVGNEISAGFRNDIEMYTAANTRATTKSFDRKRFIYGLHLYGAFGRSTLVRGVP